MTATFFNRGWYRAHIVPLTCGVADEVVLVTDVVIEPTKGVRYCCPPRWVARMFGRAGAKLIWGLAAAIRRRPDWCVGYHLFPGALTALIIGRLVGRPVCYQMTGGPVELIGGGFGAENRLLTCLARPCTIVERWALAVVRCFDLIIVRGGKARLFLERAGVTCPIAVIPGAVSSIKGPANTGAVSKVGDYGQAKESYLSGLESRSALREGHTPQECRAWETVRTYDLVFVGRLTQFKQPEQFVRIVAQVSRSVPLVSAAMVGDGPLEERLRQLAEDAGVADRIDFMGACKDVAPILDRSRVFVLTSRSEGLSIAMLEAMAAGLPAVVADVGELREAVDNGRNGWLVTPDAIEEYADHIVLLLRDPALYERMSAAARQSALDLASIEAVCGRWRHAIDAMYGSTPAAGAAACVTHQRTEVNPS